MSHNVDELLRNHPELAREVDDLIKRKLTGKGLDRYAAADASFPQFVFDADGSRGHGQIVQVRNSFGHRQAGTIECQLNRAYLVDIGDTKIVVHEGWDAWVQRELEGFDNWGAISTLQEKEDE